MRATQNGRTVPDWAQLLVEAVNTPGVLSKAYSTFWNYSVGNQLLAMFECIQRGLTIGPIHTFVGWLELGRHVVKGQTAITLCMPVTVKLKNDTGTSESSDKSNGAGGSESLPGTKTVFIYRPRWFVLSQTEGEPYVPTELPEWSERRALAALNIERVEFTHPDGNCQGFARVRQVAVSPIAVLPHKTLIHELAHIVLGHTAEGTNLEDHDRTPRDLREVEAECTALICCESLDMPGIPESRGYIQHWLAGQTIPDRSAQRIFKAADMILKAGRPVEPSMAINS
jgi:antirestriction protein ArdC